LANRPKTNETEIQRVKMQRAADGKQAKLEYESEAAAIRAKTAAASTVVTTKPKAKAAKKGKSSATLSDWLKGRETDGF
jgi:23S rRNA pseudoU1915 N3-methylase RlmH